MDPQAPGKRRLPRLRSEPSYLVIFAARERLAENCSFPVTPIAALPGRTLTPVMGVRIVTLAEAASQAPPVWLVAVMVTGLGDGNPAGAI